MVFKKTTTEIPPGMFTVTKPQRYAKDLKEWESFLEKKGIKTAIVETSSSKFVLCREGQEAHAEL